jgi:transcriptional regulator with XRE-family HTH domain
MKPDDERIGRLVRKLRRTAGLTQEQLSSKARVSVEALAAIEMGRVGTVRVDQARAVLEALDGHLYLRPWWRGASADRLIDADHAEIGEHAAKLFVHRFWRTAMEVTFAEYGERGSIDLLGGFQPTLTAAVCEVKSAFGSLEETNRTLDAKVRLAPKIVERTFGWRPRNVARLLIVRDDSTNRRVVAQHATTMGHTYPARSREIRAWLRRPDGALAGLWFLSIPAKRGKDSD